MTDRELMQQALKAMGTVGADWICESSHHDKKDQHKWAEPCPLQQRWHIAYQALHERLAQPEQEPVCAHDIPKIKCSFCHVEYKQPEQEPVAWRNKETGEFCTGGFLQKDWARWTPLYTTPPRREWVGLTDEEITVIASTPCAVVGSYVHTFARAIEAKLKEKNA